MAHYEPAWESFDRFLAERLDRGVGLIRALDDHWRDRIDTFFGRRLMTEVRSRLEAELGAEALAGKRLAVADGGYRLVPDDVSTGRIVGTVLEILRREPGVVSWVVELGCGIGENLFRIHAALPPGEAEALRFVGCEITESGRAGMRRLLGHAAGMDLSVQPYDYYQPDYRFLPRGAHVLVFTSHSIEQIPRLPTEALTDLLEHTGRCLGVHGEPCGWQMDAELVRLRTEGVFPLRRTGLVTRARRRAAAAVGRALGPAFGRRLWDPVAESGLELPPDLLDRRELVSKNSMSWSRAHDYNTNLSEVLKGLEQAGSIHVVSRAPNRYGDNPFNASTLIHWRKNPADAPSR